MNLTVRDVADVFFLDSAREFYGDPENVGITILAALIILWRKAHPTGQPMPALSERARRFIPFAAAFTVGALAAGFFRESPVSVPMGLVAAAMTYLVFWKRLRDV